MHLFTFSSLSSFQKILVVQYLALHSLPLWCLPKHESVYSAELDLLMRIFSRYSFISQIISYIPFLCKNFYPSRPIQHVYFHSIPKHISITIQQAPGYARYTWKRYLQLINDWELPDYLLSDLAHSWNILQLPIKSVQKNWINSINSWE